MALLVPLSSGYQHQEFVRHRRLDGLVSPAGSSFSPVEVAAVVGVSPMEATVAVIGATSMVATWLIVVLDVVAQVVAAALSVA